MFAENSVAAASPEETASATVSNSFSNAPSEVGSIDEEEGGLQNLVRKTFGDMNSTTKTAIIVGVIIFVGLFLLILLYFLFRTKYTPILYLEDGAIQGSISKSRNGCKYWQYLGVPYAQPPTDEWAYAPPKNHEGWPDIIRATKYPPSCIQRDVFFNARVKGQLDCLYLNVFVHKGKNDNDTKPVIVWIHGGGYISGSSKIYQPDYLMDEDVVLVTCNYRLGPYGFLNLGTENAPGNVGLLDQNLVLQWVQRNILRFGGDPNRVTLSGESAGGASTHLHMLSPLSKGLFQRAILQSGTALMPWAFTQNPKAAAQQFASQIGCEGSLETCFANLQKSHLARQTWWLDPLNEDDIFRPSIDGRLLKDTPENIFTSGNYPTDIPVMLGVTSAEGVLRSGRIAAMPELIEKLEDDWDTLISNFLMMDKPLSLQQAHAIKYQYFGNQSLTQMDKEEVLEKLTKLATDAIFFHGLHKTAVILVKNGAPVYAYYYDYVTKILAASYTALRAFRTDSWIPTEISLAMTAWWDWVKERVFRGKGGHKYGVGHGEDLYQIWDYMGLTHLYEWFDRDFSRSFVKAVVDFASGTEPLRFREEIWPVVTKRSNGDEQNMMYMIMDNEPGAKVMPEPFAERIEFWIKLLDQP